MTLKKESLASRRPDLWRYREVLPVEDDNNIVSLGKVGRHCCARTRLERRVGIQELYIKDESQNPTQSFKARGMAAAVSMAKELGAKKLAVHPPEMLPAHWRPTLLARAQVVHLYAARYPTRKRGRV
jgi:threonine synthase